MYCQRSADPDYVHWMRIQDLWVDGENLTLDMRLGLGLGFLRSHLDDANVEMGFELG